MKKTSQYFILILAALSGCNTTGEEENLRQAEMVWSRNKILDYTLTYRLRCYCPENNGVIEVNVVEGRVQGALFVDQEQGHQPSSPLTVDKLYFELNNNYLRRGYNVEFQYNEKTGVPTYIRLEHPKGMDSVVTFELLKFTRGPKKIKGDGG